MPPTSVRATIAICTWNRADLLDRTLSEMRRLTIPDGVTWEVLVVNNNSTDHTDAVIDRHRGHLPLRRAFEPVAGLSRARNRAIDEARGDLIIWTDDDVLVTPEWLGAYVIAADAHSDVTVFGGPVLPWFETPPPRWVADNVGHLEGPFALTDPMAETRQPVGANMAFRREALSGERFDPQLGRIGEGLLSGDETALIERLEAQGQKRLYVRDAVVRHFVPAARMTPRYVWDWFYNAGRTRARMQGDLDHDVALLWGVPRWVWRAWAQNRAELMVRSMYKNPRWLRSLEMSARYQGQIVETRRLARER